MPLIKSVFVTGGTGNIGSSIVEELIAHKYQVMALCKDANSASNAENMGAIPVHGSLTQLSTWIYELENCDALIHTACTFDESMGDVDYALMKAISEQTAQRNSPLILVYTAGCWTFGDHTQVITELTPKNSISDFQWMLDNIAFLSDIENIDLRVVSPANVVSQEQHFLPPILLWEIERCGHPTLPVEESQTWPLVERKNLAELYRLVMEKGRKGEEYICSAEQSAPLNRLLRKLSSQPIESNI